MINTLSVVFVILPFTNVFVPCPFTFGTIGIGAVSVAFIVLKLTNVFVPTGIGIGAVSVLFAVLPFTNVFVPFGMGIGTVSVHFSVLEFANVFVPIASLTRRRVGVKTIGTRTRNYCGYRLFSSERFFRRRQSAKGIMTWLSSITPA